MAAAWTVCRTQPASRFPRTVSSSSRAISATASCGTGFQPVRGRLIINAMPWELSIHAASAAIAYLEGWKPVPRRLTCCNSLLGGLRQNLHAVFRHERHDFGDFLSRYRRRGRLARGQLRKFRDEFLEARRRTQNQEPHASCAVVPERVRRVARHLEKCSRWRGNGPAIQTSPKHPLRQCGNKLTVCCTEVVHGELARSGRKSVYNLLFR